MNEILRIELEDEDVKELLKAAIKVRDLDQEPDAETIVIDQIKKQVPNLAQAPHITQVEGAIEILHRYGDAHGIDATKTPLAVYQKHFRTSESALPSRKRQKKQPLTELLNFGGTTASLLQAVPNSRARKQ